MAAGLREDFDVLSLDSRGQGRSEDGPGPITYGRMASDVVAFMDALGIERAHVVGHSDGGCVSIHLLIDHPDCLHSATPIGTPLHLYDYRAGTPAGLVAFTSALAADTGEDPFGFGEHYRRLSSQPERWPVVARKLGATWRTQPTFSDDALRQVEMPVLVIGAGRDEFLDRRVFERTAALFPK